MLGCWLTIQLIRYRKKNQKSFQLKTADFSQKRVEINFLVYSYRFVRWKWIQLPRFFQIQQHNLKKTNIFFKAETDSLTLKMAKLCVNKSKDNNVDCSRICAEVWILLILWKMAKLEVLTYFIQNWDDQFQIRIA